MFPFNKLWILPPVDDLRLPVVDDPVDAVVVRLGRLLRGVEVGCVDGVLRGQRLDERSDALVHGPLHVTCAKETRIRMHDSIDCVSTVSQPG